MDTKVKNWWYHLRGSFWFIPALMAVSATILSVVTTAVDRMIPRYFDLHRWWLYGSDPVGARTVLSVISSSMITVAGVVFSITIVVLTLASSQFGPRLIRNFMLVKANQMVLGTFVATFIYSILVLNSVNALEGEAFIPSLSVSIAIFLSLMSLAFLIYYIHSVSESIQAQHIISRVCGDLDKAVTRIFSQKIDHEQQISSGAAERVYDIPTTCDRDACSVKAEKSGYLQAVDNQALMRIAIDADLLIHLGHRPGHFITSGCTLVTIWPGHKVDSDLSRKINTIFIVGPERTLEQDVEFAISQLVEITVRALSPGVNDPITAITCIDWLGAALCQLADCKMPASHRFDDHNRLRIICKPYTFKGMVDAAFNMIRQHATTSAAVSIHLLETITTIATRARSDDQRAALLRQATMVVPGCEKQLSTDEDRGDLAARYDAAVKALDSQKAASL